MRGAFTRRKFNLSALGGAVALSAGSKTGALSLFAASPAGPNLTEGADIRRVGIRKNGSYWGGMDLSALTCFLAI